jgi:transcriptional regulator with PAS, ATPase and Fis domain
MPGSVQASSLPQAFPERSSKIVRQLVDAVDDPLFIIDRDTLRFLAFNAAAVLLLGYSRQELLDIPADRVFGWDSAAARRISMATASVDAGSTLVTKDGSSVCGPLEGRSIAEPSWGRILVVRCRRHHTAHSMRPSTTVADHAAPFEANADFPTIIGQSEQICGVCRLIGLVAKTDTTVLIRGESGTGKELVGQAVHYHSRRARGPLVKLNCAALTESLLESELFGHKRGAFTGAIQDRKGRFQLANGGTLILDEIGSMPLSGQVKLLRVLQEREFEPVGDSITVRVDVRVIAITNTDLATAIREGRFREDLYYRLSAFPIHLPPLRERRTDIPRLARHFIRKYVAVLNKPIEGIDPDALVRLMEYTWPGNIRELQNALEYAAILEEGPIITSRSLPLALGSVTCANASLHDRLRSSEKDFILEALSRTNGVRSQAARLLGIDRRNLNYFLHKHGIGPSSLPAIVGTEVEARINELSA